MFTQTCARRRAQERVRIFSYAFGVDAVFSDVQVGCKTDATLRAGCNLWVQQPVAALQQ
jgi:hypothetical protein